MALPYCHIMARGGGGWRLVRRPRGVPRHHPKYCRPRYRKTCKVMALPKQQCYDFPSLNLQSKLFWENFIFFKLPQLGPKLFKLYRLGVFWNPQDLLLMMGTEIFKIDASWAEKLTKTRVQFLLTPTVGDFFSEQHFSIM